MSIFLSHTQIKQKKSVEFTIKTLTFVKVLSKKTGFKRIYSSSYGKNYRLLNKTPRIHQPDNQNV